MKKIFLTYTTFLVLVALPLTAFQKPKSQKEVDALKKVQASAQANDPAAELAAINEVLENFADTEYKPMLLQMAMDAAQRQNDFASVTLWGDRVIQSDPNNIPARVTLAESIAGHTRENDLDKDQSLKKVNEYATKALELLKAATAAPAGVAEAQWPDYKKQLTSQAYDALGQAGDLSKNFPDSIKNFQSAIEANPTNPVPVARLSKAYVDAKQWDEAISTADKVLAMNDLPPSVKSFAQSQKDAATKMKGAGAK